MKKIIFYEINIFNFIIIILFKLFNYRVYYLTISNLLKFQKLIKVLPYIGIVWYNYQNNFYANYSFIKKKNSHIANKHGAKISNKILFDNFYLDKSFWKVILSEILYKNINKYSELFIVAKILQKNDENIYFWISKNELFYQLENKYNNFYLIKPKLLSHLHFVCIFLLSNFLKFIKINFTNFLKIFKKQINKKSPRINSSSQSLFFPHHGVVNGVDNKTFFYSNNKNDLFYKKKLIHVEWNLNDLNFISKKYYKINKIEPLAWNSIQYRFHLKYEFFLKIFIFFLKNIYSLNLIFLISIIKSLIKIEINKNKLENFDKLKFVLVGYDYLFPKDLAIACKIKKINIIAFQNRMAVSAWNEYNIFDYYFVIGKKSFNDLRQQFYKKTKIIEAGLDLEASSITKKFKLKLLKRLTKKNKYKFVCTIFDIKSELDWYRNGRTPIYNWKNNYEFYEIIQRLVENNSNVFFILKGKNYNWTKINFFKKILIKFNKLNNFIILDKYKNIDSNHLIGISDFAVAIHTSAVDNMLSFGKPVLIYDKARIIDAFINYKQLFAYNEKDLVNKFNLLINNYKSFNNQINGMRNYFYTKFDKLRLNSELDRIKYNI